MINLHLELFLSSMRAVPLIDETCSSHRWDLLLPSMVGTLEISAKYTCDYKYLTNVAVVYNWRLHYINCWIEWQIPWSWYGKPIRMHVQPPHIYYYYSSILTTQLIGVFLVAVWVYCVLQFSITWARINYSLDKFNRLKWKNCRDNLGPDKISTGWNVEASW